MSTCTACTACTACATVALVLASLVPSPLRAAAAQSITAATGSVNGVVPDSTKAVETAADEARLPPGASVVHRARSLWEVDKQTLLLTGVVVVGQFLLIGALLVQRERRRQSEGRHRALLRAMPDLMFLQTADGVYLDCHVSDQVRLLMQPEQFMGRNMRDVLPPELLTAIEPAFTQAVGSTEPVLVEYELTMPDGVRRYEARLLSQDDRVLTLVRDITERQRAADALLESQERYDLATAAGAVGVWDWNFETNELFVDARLKSILGFEDREISNRADDWGSRVHPQDVPAAAAAIQACVDRVSDTYEVEHRMMHKDGSVKWLLSRGSAIRAADGRMVRLVGTKVDITERKLVDEVIRENEAVLQASHREIHDLAGRLIALQEVERARIARELHDDFSQQIAGLSIALSSLNRRLRALPGGGGDLHRRGLVAAAAHDRTGRQHSGSLARPASQRAAACRPRGRALRVLRGRQSPEHPVARLHGGGRLRVDFRRRGAVLYRVTQEGLRNVITHAKAGHAEVRLERIGDRAALTITDDGRGFDVAQASHSSHGLGLVSIKERVRLAGGTAAIVTELKKGTSLRVQVPANGPGAQQSQIRPHVKLRVLSLSRRRNMWLHGGDTGPDSPAVCVGPAARAVLIGSAEPRRVVLLYDERTDLPGLAILDASLVQSLTAGPAGAVEVYREAMDLSRFGSATYLPLLRDYLRAKYAAKKIDVVVAAMGPSLDFLLATGRGGVSRCADRLLRDRSTRACAVVSCRST